MNDAASSPTKVPPAGEPDESRTRTIPFRRAYFDAWKDLCRSRDRLLLDFYVGQIRTRDANFVEPATPQEARECLATILQCKTVSNAEWKQNESKIVFQKRIVAAWLVFWPTVMPLGVVAAMWVHWLNQPHALERRNLIDMSLCSAIVLPFFFVLGMAAMVVLTRPFNAFVAKFVSARKGTGLIEGTQSAPLKGSKD